MKKIISISGLGYTGSSALVDYFHNHELVYSIESEFFPFRIVDGFFDLYRALFFYRKSDVENFYSVLKFKKIMRTLYLTRYNRNKELHFRYFTLILPIKFNVLGKFFLKNVNNFIRIISIRVSKVHNSHTYLINSSIIYSIIKRVERIAGIMHRLKLVRFRFNVRDKIAVYTTDTKLFVNSMIKTCFDNFKVLNKSGKLDILVLNQAFSVFDSDILKNHDDLGLILFVRDPRDIYVEAIKNNIEWMVGSSEDNNQRLEEFIQYQIIKLNTLEALEKIENVLIIDFADFVFDHLYVIRKINSFIGIPINNYNQKTGFIANNSAKNVGIHKKYPYKHELEKIKSSLTGLYSFE